MIMLWLLLYLILYSCNIVVDLFVNCQTPAPPSKSPRPTPPPFPDRDNLRSFLAGLGRLFFDYMYCYSLKQIQIQI
jgi:hypothetical protein